jgi:hypothetical protein
VFTQTGKYSAKLIKAHLVEPGVMMTENGELNGRSFKLEFNQKGYISRSAYNHHNLNKTFQSFFWEIQ